MPAEKFGVPVLHLDDEDAGTTDGDDVYFVRPNVRMLRVVDVREQDPGSFRLTQLDMQSFDSNSLAVVDEGAARDVADHRYVPSLSSSKTLELLVRRYQQYRNPAIASCLKKE